MTAKQTKPQFKKTRQSQSATLTKLQSPPESIIAKRMLWFLFAVAFLLFGNTLGHGFVLDDVAVIEQNKFVQQGIAGIPKILSTFYWQGYWDSNAGLYRPLSLICFAIEWTISPNNPFIHHFVNVLLYAVTTSLLFQLLRRLLTGYSMWIPFFITLLFTIHPIHSEVVANIKSRDEILCFMFFILSFNFILKNGLASLCNKLIAGGLFLLCLLSKEAGILFLPVIGLYFLLFRKDTILKTALQLAPLLVISIIWFGLHQYITASSSFERITYTYLDNSVVACESTQAKLATGIAILGRYMLKSVFPYVMSYDYSYNEIPCETFTSPIVSGTLISVCGLIYLISRFWKTQPVISFGLLFFFISSLLVTNIFTLIGTTMGDRLLYAPVLGMCITVVFGSYKLFRQTHVQTYNHSTFYGLILLGLFASITAFRRNRDWESNTTLFTADVTHAPNSARVHFNYGVILMSQLPEDVERQAPLLPTVISSFKRAIAIDSLDGGSHINLGVCYYRMKDYPRAILHTKKAMFIEPGDKTLCNNLADSYFKSNNFDSSIVYYNKTLASNLGTATTYNFLGVAWFNKKVYSEAITVFQTGLQQFPENEEMWMNLGNAFGMSANYPKALETFAKVISINPNNKQAYYFMALTYQTLGDVAKAKAYMDTYNTK